MALDFVETLTLTVPDVEEQIAAFSESDYNTNHGLIIEVAAIHEGMTANFNYYSESALRDSLASWTSPYPKPIILNHDTETEPVGRVMGAKIENETDGTPYVKLQVAIKDPNAISKVMDQRYLTGSVGGRAEEANCSICGTDWTQASMFQAPCKHTRGKTYKGEVAHLKLSGLSFKEYSFVNVPADQRSTVRALQTATASAENEPEDDWTRPVHVFALDMNDEKIVEFSESADRNVLEGMRKKDSTPVYLNLKGAFLTTLAAMELDDTKESNVSENTPVDDEDILAVTDDLSADLASADEDNEPEADDENAAADDAEGNNDDADADDDAILTAPEGAEGDEDDDDEPTAAAEDDEDSDDDGEPAEDAPARPQGQEHPHGTEPELPENRESADDAGNVEEDATEAEGGTDLSEAVTALESRVTELEAREATLLEENKRLKAALKRQLVEHVVDTKISLGLGEASQREALITEHTTRSAASLADTMRDLATMAPRHAALENLPTLSEAAGAVPDKGNVINVNADGTGEEPVDEDVEEDETVDPEKLFVDVLMGRKTL